MNDQTYLDSGFNNYFQREVVPNSGNSSQVSQFDFETNYIGLSANQIASGIMASANKRLSMDLDGESFVASDGVVQRVRLGRLEDGSYGLLIKDKNDNTLMQISGETNFLKSPNGRLEMNFDNTQILVKDTGDNVVALIGEHIGGF